jgi:hemin uptake protein HemP
MIETLMSQERPETRVPPPVPRKIVSSELLAGQKEVWILHGQETYRLRLTRSGKLILQK